LRAKANIFGCEIKNNVLGSRANGKANPSINVIPVFFPKTKFDSELIKRCGGGGGGGGSSSRGIPQWAQYIINTFYESSG
jgi:hypothetical protein